MPTVQGMTLACIRVNVIAIRCSLPKLPNVKLTGSSDSSSMSVLPKRRVLFSVDDLMPGVPDRPVGN